jgi:hypothetical protein
MPSYSPWCTVVDVVLSTTASVSLRVAQAAQPAIADIPAVATEASASKGYPLPLP